MLFIHALMLRLAARPIVFAVTSPIVYALLAYWIPGQFASNMYLKPLGSLSQQYAGAVALAILGYASLLGLAAGYRYYQWTIGETPSCPRCGTMMEARSGRRGFFWGCLRYPDCRGTEDY